MPSKNEVSRALLFICALIIPQSQLHLATYEYTLTSWASWRCDWLSFDIVIQSICGLRYVLSSLCTFLVLFLHVHHLHRPPATVGVAMAVVFKLRERFPHSHRRIRIHFPHPRSFNPFVFKMQVSKCPGYRSVLVQRLWKKNFETIT